MGVSPATLHPRGLQGKVFKSGSKFSNQWTGPVQKTLLSDWVSEIATGNLAWDSQLGAGLDFSQNQIHQ